VDDRLEVSIRHRLTRLDLDVELHVGDETLGLIGPSAAGKTSVLRAVAGLWRPASGRILCGGRTLFDRERGVDVPPEGRGIGLVFQDGALFPHLSVAQNVAFGVRRRGRSSTERRSSVAALLDRFGLMSVASSMPGELSGGERQRVALARAVASDPKVLLLDEPVSALDPVSRAHITAELDAHLRALRLPTILVSHDFADVAGLASRVAVIEAGSVLQEGSPAELVQGPRSEFVAALAGVNYLAGVASRRRGLTKVVTTSGTAIFSADSGQGPVAAVVSPWDVAVSLARPEGSALNWMAGPVRRVITVGSRVRVTVGSDPPIVAEVTEESKRQLSLAIGVPVVATWKATGTRLIPLTP
jgi:ABC-type sulfate/molybdate transport systems ATPase subunit